MQQLKQPSQGGCRPSVRHKLTAMKPQPAVTSSENLKLTATSLLQYERKGWCVVRNLLESAVIKALQRDVTAHLEEDRLLALRHRIRVLCPGVDPASIHTLEQANRVLQRKATDTVGFLQSFNLHRTCPSILELACSKELAGTAAQLLDSRKVRLYQDCIFAKEPGYGATNWHTDLRMAPFDTNSFVTAWIPLREIGGSTQQDSGLQFATASHRDFALPYWHNLEGKDLSDRKYKIETAGALQLGDVTWHHGWTLHSAGEQPPGSLPRLAMTFSYFADGAQLLRRRDRSARKEMLHSEDAESYSDWLPDLKDGAVARHRMLPIVWPAAHTAQGTAAQRPTQAAVQGA